MIKFILIYNLLGSPAFAAKAAGRIVCQGIIDRIQSRVMLDAEFEAFNLQWVNAHKEELAEPFAGRAANHSFRGMQLSVENLNEILQSGLMQHPRGCGMLCFAHDPLDAVRYAFVRSGFTNIRTEGPRLAVILDVETDSLPARATGVGPYVYGDILPKFIKHIYVYNRNLPNLSERFERLL